MENIMIRNIEEKDIPSVVDIKIDGWKSAYKGIIDSNKFTQDIPNIDCELLALYVKPKLKYNGIGTRLFQFVINDFKSKNKNKMILWCLKDNEPSKKFYTKMGGKISKERTIEIGEREYLEVGFEYNI